MDNIGWSPDANSGRIGAGTVCTRSVWVIRNCDRVGGLIHDRNRVAEKRVFTRCGLLKLVRRTTGSDLVHVIRHGFPVRTLYRTTSPAEYSVS